MPANARPLPPAPAPSRGLIVCADDYAIHAGASSGIAQLAAMGRISATSALVRSPRWAEDADWLRPFKGRLAVGLHLDWTSEFAVRAGHGLALRQAIGRSLWGGFERRAARAEIECQLDAFEAVWGAPPDFVDGHQHVQQFDGIRQALIAALLQRCPEPARRPWLRVSAPPGWRAAGKDWVIAALGSFALKRGANYAHLTCANGLLGAYSFDLDPTAYDARMALWLGRAHSGSVLMVHPAASAPADDPIGAARLREWAYLSSPAWPARLAQAGCQLIRQPG